MSKLKIAVSDSCPDCFTTQRECIYINESRNIDVAAMFYRSTMLHAENSMKSMPRVMASRYLLLLKIKNVYPQSICPVFRVSLRIANRDENFMVAS